MEFLAKMRLNSTAGTVSQPKSIRGSLHIEVLQEGSVLCERTFHLECRSTIKGRRYLLELHLTARKEKVFSYKGLLGKNVDEAPLTDSLALVQLLVTLANTCISHNGIHECLIDFKGAPLGTSDRLLALCRGVAH